MPKPEKKKCESCKHFKSGAADFCTNPEIGQIHAHSRQAMVILWSARQRCDKEGDGIFVYFEPKDPATGEAFEISNIRSEIPALATQPDDWRKQMNLLFRTAGGKA